MTKPRDLDQPIEAPRFTEEQVHALVDYLIDAGQQRGKAQGADFSEADYLAGGMAALFALGLQSAVPAGWVFGILSGRSPLGLSTRDKTQYLVYDPKAEEGERFTLYEDRNLAREHSETLWWDESNNAVQVIELPARHTLHPKIQQLQDEAED